MYCKLNKKVISDLHDDFPKVFEKRNNDELNYLNQYFEEQEKILLKISHFEDFKNDKDIDTKSFCQHFFDICDLYNEREDKELFVEHLLGKNYKICILKTEIPYIKNVLTPNRFMSVMGLINGVFAVKDGVMLDLEHVYSQNELSLLQREHKIVFLYKERNHKDNLSVDEYLRYSSLDKKGDLLCLDDYTIIDNDNYAKLLRGYPEIFELIRDNLDFMRLEDILFEYEYNLIRVIDEELKKCDELISLYQNRSDNIKLLRKKL